MRTRTISFWCSKAVWTFTVTLGPGEMFVVPKGVEHRPVAAEETHVLLIEPQGTPNTGNAATAAARRVI
jgi:mannose-6-phosphate isomerase-like protein (cupin superfamily)